jgi:hypothetical protein
MKKKLGVLILLLTGLSVTAFAQNRGDFEFNPEEGIITGFNGNVREVVIPARINGVPVAAIGNSAFKDKNLTSVSIPDNVKNIGPNAFDGNDLDKIIIGDDVEMMTSSFPPSFISKYLLEPSRSGGTYSFLFGKWDYSPEGVRDLSEPEYDPAQLAAQNVSPINIVIHNYVGKPQPGQLVEGAMPPGMMPPMDPSAPPPFPPAASAPPARQAVGNATVMPGLPDPNSNKLYRLQVGAFNSQNAAAHTFRTLQDAGFNPVYEHSQNFYRVVIADVPASSVAGTVQRLVQAGISQIWVRE